jgi:hypothetical protein
MSYSRDGGLSWTASRVPRVGVIGGQPVVQPNGNVVVPIDNASETALGYTISTNGGVKFGQAFTITSISAADDPGNIRSGPVSSAEISGDGTIYVVWEDCRFRTGCPGNDLVYVTSTNGTTWSAVQRIPIDAVISTADHFIPGVAVDRATSGAGIHVGVTYYFYPGQELHGRDLSGTGTARSRRVRFRSSTSPRRMAAPRGARRRRSPAR